MNMHISLKSMKEGERMWISPRNLEIRDDGNSDEGLWIDYECSGQPKFSPYYSALVVKKSDRFLVFLTQTAINVYRTFKFRSFTSKVGGRVFLHPKITFNAHTLCEYYGIGIEDSLILIEMLEETLFGPNKSFTEVASKMSDKLNLIFKGTKVFTSNFPFSSKPLYRISIMPTDFQLKDKFLAIDNMGLCHFKTLSELKDLDHSNKVAMNG